MLTMWKNVNNKHNDLPLTHCCQHNIILFNFCHLMEEKHLIALMHNSLLINEVNISLYLWAICFLSVKCLFISIAHFFLQFISLQKVL